MRPGRTPGPVSYRRRSSTIARDRTPTQSPHPPRPDAQPVRHRVESRGLSRGRSRRQSGVQRLLPRRRPLRAPRACPRRHRTPARPDRAPAIGTLRRGDDRQVLPTVGAGQRARTCAHALGCPADGAAFCGRNIHLAHHARSRRSLRRLRGTRLPPPHGRLAPARHPPPGRTRRAPRHRIGRHPDEGPIGQEDTYPVRLKPDRVRDGVRLLRDRPDGPDPLADARRDRGPVVGGEMAA